MISIMKIFDGIVWCECSFVKRRKQQKHEFDLQKNVENRILASALISLYYSSTLFVEIFAGTNFRAIALREN